MEHLLPLAWMKERSLTIGAEDVVEVGNADACPGGNGI